MKIINLNESQFGRLFSEGIENFGQSNTKEFQDQGETTITSKKTTKDGKGIEDSNPNFDIGDEICPQQWGTRYGGIRTAPSF